jgi:hypothetical protein
MSIAEDTKSVVGAYYPAGVRGELPAFSPHVAAEFSVTAPDYLPWGGAHLGKAFFDDVLHHLPETLDFSRVRYDSFTAEGTHAVALITIGIADAPHTVKISQRWEVKDALAQSIWVAYFQPQALLDKLGIAHSLSHSCAQASACRLAEEEPLRGRLGLTRSQVREMACAVYSLAANCHIAVSASRPGSTGLRMISVAPASR